MGEVDWAVPAAGAMTKEEEEGVMISVALVESGGRGSGSAPEQGRG